MSVFCALLVDQTQDIYYDLFLGLLQQMHSFIGGVFHQRALKMAGELIMSFLLFIHVAHEQNED